MKSKQQIAEQLKDHLKEHRKNNGRQGTNTKLCRAFLAGDYQEYTDQVQFTTVTGQKKRATVQINKIRPYVNSVKGFLAQNRRKQKYLARLPESKIQGFYSQYANTLSDALRRKMNADQVETQQDGDMLTCGLGVTETAMSYGEGFASRSANGEVVMSCIDLDNFFYDPSTRATNMLDAGWMGVTKKFKVDDALDLFSDSKEEDFEQETETSSSDYQYKGDIGAYDRIKYDWHDKKEAMVNVHFYQWYDIEPFYRAENPVGKMQNPEGMMRSLMEMETIAQEVHENDEDFKPKDEILHFNAETKKLLETAFGEFIAPEEFRRRVYYTAVASGEKVFTAFKSEHQTGFSLKVKTGDYDAKNKIWVGMVNSMMEPQKYYNKLLTELMFVIAANSKGGVLYEEGSIVDIEEFEAQYAKTDGACEVANGALTSPGGRRIVDKRTAFQPTGYEELITLMAQDIPDASGIDKTFLGSSESTRETAVLQRQRIRQIVSMLACYVDSIDLFGSEHARLMLDLMRIFAENNRGDLFRSDGNDGTAQFIELGEDKLNVDFDIITEEAPVTPEERQMMADKLSLIADKYLSVSQFDKANAFYALATKYMALDQSDAEQLNAILMPDGQQIDPAMVQKLILENQQLKDVMTQAQVKNVEALTQKALVDASKSKTEADLNIEKLADVRAGVHKKAAETTRTIQDAEKIDKETKLMTATTKGRV